MTTTFANPNLATDQAIVATFKNHFDAEAAARLLVADNIPMTAISIIGRNYETIEDVQGFYRPADAALAGAGPGAWAGGIFGWFLGAFGFFVFPVVGAIMVLGPLSGLIAGAIAGAGVGALVNALMAAGIPKYQALKYQSRLQAGEFLLLVHGGDFETSRATEILKSTSTTDVQVHP
jgi:hypothetical protein